MNTETLRAAASLMRERAEAATPGEWAHSTVLSGHVYVPGRDVAVGAPRDAIHIASWHPDVAVAVAEWLENSADVIDGLSAITKPAIAFPGCFAVASAYLGEQS